MDKLQVELNELQPELAAKSEQTSELLVNVSSEKEVAAEQRASVEEDKESMRIRAEAVQRLNDEAQVGWEVEGWLGQASIYCTDALMGQVNTSE